MTARFMRIIFLEPKAGFFGFGFYYARKEVVIIIEIKNINNAALILGEMQRRKLAALEAIGLTAEKHAKENLTAFPRVDTGRLRNSIAHAVAPSEEAVYIGTNVSYAVYVELGTGIHASDGNGRKTPWVYIDSEGKAHVTKGMKPTHYLRDAACNHSEEYKKLATTYLKG